MIKGFMCIDTMVPVVFLGFIRTHSCFVPVDVEDERVHGFQILL